MPKDDQKNKKGFKFFECTRLIQPTGRKARDLTELLSCIEIVAPGVIYHHTHEYYLKASIQAPEYPNDFAVWAAQDLEERALAEKLACLDLYAYRDIESVRQVLSKIIKSYLVENPQPRPVRNGEEFFFNDAVTIVMESGPEAKTLPSFIEALRTVGTSSIYFHFFEARMRLQRPSDDFSIWLEQDLDRPDLAQKIRKLDPYLYSLEGLRKEILSILQ